MQLKLAPVRTKRSVMNSQIFTVALLKQKKKNESGKKYVAYIVVNSLCQKGHNSSNIKAP